MTGGIRVTNRTEAKAAPLRRDGVRLARARADARMRTPQALRGAKLVLIGVKPAMVPDLLAAIADDLEPDAIVVSVAAGVTIATMEALVPHDGVPLDAEHPGDRRARR